MHEVVQVIPQNDFSVFVYFADSIKKKYDAKHLLNHGVFIKISDIKSFMEKCTVMNNTLAWDLSGTYDPYNCIDLDPDSIYEESITVADPLNKAVWLNSSYKLIKYSPILNSLAKLRGNLYFR